MLKISFFGSDAFSVASLARLLRLQHAHPSLISSIDVITRHIKPTGRNLAARVDLPVGTFAADHGLSIWRADSAAEILDVVPRGPNHLAVAVSYGRLIPAAFLAQTGFGGLNVHPSLLPTFSGSSPLQYALMNDVKHTGVSVQTLHPTKFDCGDILAQTPPMPVYDNDTYSSLQHRMAEAGAELLAGVIASGAYKDPVSPICSPYPFSLAGKIAPATANVDWITSSSRSVRRLSDALGPLHTYKMVDITKKKKRITRLDKVILDDIRVFDEPLPPLLAGSLPGTFLLHTDNRMLVKTADSAVSVGSLKYQCCSKETPSTFSTRLGKRTGNTPLIFETGERS